jgi:hypothetical protein
MLDANLQGLLLIMDPVGSRIPGHCCLIINLTPPAGSGVEPSYFQPEETREVDPDPAPEVRGVAATRAPPHVLLARLNQILRFSLNYLTSSNQSR